jgi:hypothetical protein
LCKKKGKKLFLKEGYSESSKHSRSTSLVRDRLREAKNIVLEEEIIFQRCRKSQKEIDRKTIPSPHSVVQREKDIIPVAPVDMFRDITARHKMPK